MEIVGQGTGIEILIMLRTKIGVFLRMLERSLR